MPKYFNLKRKCKLQFAPAGHTIMIIHIIALSIAVCFTPNRVHENIIIIGDPSKTHQKPIGDPSQTNMHDRRTRHASSETYMPHRRLTSLIGDPSETDILHRRQTCPIQDQHSFGDLTETNMPVESNRNLNIYMVVTSIKRNDCRLLYSGIYV